MTAPKSQNPNPTIQISSLEKKLLEEQERQLAEFKPQTVAGRDDTGASAHKPTEQDSPFEDKIYLFPESYNALRRELHDHWPALWQMVGWPMAFQAEDFVAIMNDALDMKIQLDGNKVGATCHAYLNALRKKRGLSEIPE